MRVLYIGQYTDGTTSKMRANALKGILQPRSFQIIDTHKPFFKTHKIWRSLAFRYKQGPTVSAINNYVDQNIKNENYDLIWVDKAFLISPNITLKLRYQTKNLVHYTPDMMFYENRSKAFIASIKYYDLLVTTKSRELSFYKQYVNSAKLLWVTQGYDSSIHKGSTSFEAKRNATCFIGLAELSREQMVQFIIDNGISVYLAGMGWHSFVNKNRNHPHLHYLGESLKGLEYSQTISSVKFGLGLLSKRFPELHTTRTIEIPACGTALLTEYNEETKLLYNEDEVIFFRDKEDLVQRINFYFQQDEALKSLTQKGHQKVVEGNYTYQAIIRRILNHIQLE